MPNPESILITKGIGPKGVALTGAVENRHRVVVGLDAHVAAGDVDPEGVHMLSTSGMLKHVSEHPQGSFIVATETGMLHPLHKSAPDATLIEANRMAYCKYMKMITLPKLRDCLRDLGPEVKVDEAVAERARLPIERMVAIG